MKIRKQVAGLIMMAATFSFPACCLVGHMMADFTRSYWAQQHSSRFFVFGGCLFWVLFFWLAAFYYATKIGLWAVVMAVLVVALLPAVVADSIRNIRNIRRN